MAKKKPILDETPVAQEVPPAPSPEPTPEPQKINKSALIRQYLEQYKGMGPTELANFIMQQHTGVKITVSEISNIRSKLNQPTGKSSMKAKSVGGSLVSNLKAFQDAVEAVGGKDEAAELLKLLN